MKTITDAPRIYIACLGCYNEGRLHGFWVDVPEEADELHTEVLELFDADDDGYLQCPGKDPESIHEEYAVHDFEGLHGYNPGEHPDWEELCRVAALFEEHDPEVVGAALSCYADVDEAATLVENGYGEYDDAEDYAYQLADNDGELQGEPWWAMYVDWKQRGEAVLSGESYCETESGRLIVWYR